MALCVALAVDGTLVPTGEAVEACTGYVLQSGSEYSTATLIASFLDWPDAGVAAGWVVGPFAFVLGSYVIARLAGSVVGMFGR